MDLLLVRHGKPDPGGASDKADPPLSELGHQQAAAMVEYLVVETVDVIYVSPQQRARQTAEPLAAALGLEPIVDERIAEFDFGSERYIPPEEVRAMAPADALAVINRMFEPDFVSRVTTAFEEIMAGNVGRTVVVVCHGGVITAIANHLLQPAEPTMFAPSYSSVSRITTSTRTGKHLLSSFNESHWLRGIGGMPNP